MQQSGKSERYLIAEKRYEDLLQARGLRVIRTRILTIFSLVDQLHKEAKKDKKQTILTDELFQHLKAIYNAIEINDHQDLIVKIDASTEKNSEKIGKLTHDCAARLIHAAHGGVHDFTKRNPKLQHQAKAYRYTETVVAAVVYLMTTLRGIENESSNVHSYKGLWSDAEFEKMRASVLTPFFGAWEKRKEDADMKVLLELYDNYAKEKKLANFRDAVWADRQKFQTADSEIKAEAEAWRADEEAKLKAEMRSR